MRDYIQEINGLPLFAGIKEGDLDSMLACLGGYVRNYQKGEFISLSEESVKCTGIILEGLIHMVHDDVWGNKTILAYMKRGELFGETFACGSAPFATAAFFSSVDCRVLFLPFHKIIHTCNVSCIFHHKLIENMVTQIADKNAQLLEKIETVSKKTLREKILSYLSLQAMRCRSSSFEIPLGRVELADYLCADRSALTRELNYMKKDGLLEFRKNTFHLLKE